MRTDFKSLIRSIPWKRHANTTIKVFSDFKNICLLILVVFTIYGIAWDTILRPSLVALKNRDDVINKQREILNEKGNLKKQYDTWAEQLKDLQHDLISITAAESGKLQSVSESGKIMRMARGELRKSLGLPPLQPPHNVLQGVAVKPVGEDQIVDLLTLLNGKPNEGSGSPSPNMQMIQNTTGLPAEAYNYELNATGTYVALVDLLNQMVLHPRLFRINKVVITRPVGSRMEEEPDPKEFPEYPVKLEMTVSLTLFLYTDANASTS